ncbi:MAG: 30S ribosomal protein S2, partial [Gammaproteobacteria bacterium]
KEVLGLRRDMEKLERGLGGIKKMASLPDALFVVDVEHEAIAVAEARKLGIPVVAVVDTNSSPDPVDYIIPGNDDAMRAIQLYANGIAEAVLDGKASVPEIAAGDDEFVELDETGKPKKKASRKTPVRRAAKKKTIRKKRKKAAAAKAAPEQPATDPAGVDAAGADPGGAGEAKADEASEGETIEAEAADAKAEVKLVDATPTETTADAEPADAKAEVKLADATSTETTADAEPVDAETESKD